MCAHIGFSSQAGVEEHYQGQLQEGPVWFLDGLRRPFHVLVMALDGTRIWWTSSTIENISTNYCRLCVDGTPNSKLGMSRCKSAGYPLLYFVYFVVFTGSFAIFGLFFCHVFFAQLISVSKSGFWEELKRTMVGDVQRLQDEDGEHARRAPRATLNPPDSMHDGRTRERGYPPGEQAGNLVPGIIDPSIPKRSMIALTLVLDFPRLG